MPSLETALLFLGAALALNLTPGPDMLYIAARSVSGGRAAGVVSALGVSVGLLFHVAAVAFGLAALLAAVPVAYDLIRIVGAIYLLALGLDLLLESRPGNEVPSLPPSRLRRIFVQGVVMDVLNPNVALFFIAFLPQLVDL